MDSSTLICRTSAGNAELAAPAHGLSITQRRFLTLLDTPATVDRLALRMSCDPQRLDRDLARLAREGLVVCEAPETDASRAAANDAGVRLGTAPSVRAATLAVIALSASTLLWWTWQRQGADPPARTTGRAPPAASPAIAREPTPGPATSASETIAVRVLRGGAAGRPSPASR